MPAVARIRSVRSLSPSLLSSMPHRYLPYYRTSSPSSSTDIASEAESTSSRDSCTCDGLKSMNISEKSASPEQRPRLPPISSLTPPRRPTHAHRRAISLSSSPAGYMLFPTQSNQRPSPIFHALAPRMPPSMQSRHQPHPSLRNTHRPHPQTQQYRPAPIRIASPPMTPIQESPRPKMDEKLMLVTPSIAAYLRQGGSVSIKGPDGKSWKVRAPIRSPTCGVRMMRM